MLTLNLISKSYGIEPILQSVTFNLNRGERMGLVGPNGCGKTTLLRIIIGEIKPDSGTVSYLPDNLRIGYLAQGLDNLDQETISDFLTPNHNSISDLENEIELVAGEIVTKPHLTGLQNYYERLLNDLQMVIEIKNRIPYFLSALGLDSVPLDYPLHQLSGGQKTRLSLVRVLLDEPQLLLLDEPTNHLDLDMLNWLEEWLRGFTGGIMLVSHDRAFLDGVATSILEIDPVTHKARVYAGNYSEYLERKSSERERHWQEYKDQQVEISRLKAAITRLRSDASFKRGGKADSGDKFAKGFFANRSRYTIQRAKHIEQRVTKLLTDEHIDKPGVTWQMKLDFQPTTTSGRDVLVLTNLSVGYGDHILLEDISRTIRFGARTILTGPNGSGKTTLLRTIAGKVIPLAGHVRLGAKVQLGYMTQEQEDLDTDKNVLDTLLHTAPFTETEARSYLHRFLFTGDDVFLLVGSLSYGERSRLSLALLVASGCNFLLLDEPINHLDIPSRIRFEQALSTFEGTVLTVVHDRYFIAKFATEIWEVKGRGIVVYYP